ncbi:hypothetical protein GCM10010377_75870 [Streptomyces viridiviolaceus]|uniref:Uncharacterized protein n=1 Tax=Streptomyces viridiviolaceus TaxID=68282 RepID=A0ABW2DZM2_9ACTN|nr:hypothetical protein [Streptomyces viridiviolaceus]GHB74296.1 hypothetical protein GCM10010377_75870 [Streptomyces viridiviolaceus]
MTNRTPPADNRPPGAKLTIRVYTVNRRGEVADDRGTVTVMDRKGPLPLHHGFPPCQCPRHRTGRAVTE